MVKDSTRTCAVAGGLAAVSSSTVMSRVSTVPARLVLSWSI